MHKRLKFGLLKILEVVWVKILFLENAPESFNQKHPVEECIRVLLLKIFPA